MRRKMCLFLSTVMLSLAFFVPSICALDIIYNYDYLNRLASAVFRDDSGTCTMTYTYDAAGNITKVSVSKGGKTMPWIPLLLLGDSEE